MLMREVPIGAIVFLDEAMNDERTLEQRETYYRRNSETTYVRLWPRSGRSINHV